jgi:hypothetical protein
MTEATFDRRLSELIEEVSQHPHKAELLQLAQEQLLDDTCVLGCSGRQDLVEAY